MRNVTFFSICVVILSCKNDIGPKWLDESTIVKSSYSTDSTIVVHLSTLEVKGKYLLEVLHNQTSKKIFSEELSIPLGFHDHSIDFEWMGYDSLKVIIDYDFGDNPKIYYYHILRD